MSQGNSLWVHNGGVECSCTATRSSLLTYYRCVYLAVTKHHSHGRHMFCSQVFKMSLFHVKRCLYKLFSSRLLHPAHGAKTLELIGRRAREWEEPLRRAGQWTFASDQTGKSFPSRAQMIGRPQTKDSGWAELREDRDYPPRSNGGSRRLCHQTNVIVTWCKHRRETWKDARDNGGGTSLPLQLTGKRTKIRAIHDSWNV